MASANRSEDDARTMPRALVLATAPIHKRAFGIAVGTALALVMFLATAVYLLRVDPEAARQQPFGPGLLVNYFYGYSLSWTGAFVALCWGFAVGFVIGWFVAFCRNLVLAASIFAIRTRSELAATRDFLDHI